MMSWRLVHLKQRRRKISKRTLVDYAVERLVESPDYLLLTKYYCKDVEIDKRELSPIKSNAELELKLTLFLFLKKILFNA